MQRRIRWRLQYTVQSISHTQKSWWVRKKYIPSGSFLPPRSSPRLKDHFNFSLCDRIMLYIYTWNIKVLFPCAFLVHSSYSIPTYVYILCIYDLVSSPLTTILILIRRCRSSTTSTHERILQWIMRNPEGTSIKYCIIGRYVMILFWYWNHTYI